MLNYRWMSYEMIFLISVYIELTSALTQKISIYPWRDFHSAQVKIPFPSASKKSKSAFVGQSKGRSLQYASSHCSTSAQESPSTPSVLQTAYAKGSTVSSEISEPILPTGIPLTPTLLLLLQFFWQQALVKEPNNPKKVKMIAVFIT